MAQLESFQTAATHIDVVHTSSVEGGGGEKVAVRLCFQSERQCNLQILLYYYILT